MAEPQKKLMKSGVIGSRTAENAAADATPAYYDLPLLKASEWTWMVPVYFFTGGLAGASYVLARLADRAGGQQLRPLARAATFISMANLAVCPPLLIADLGDPKRFLYMLRVWKPISPMNVGTWTLTAFSGSLTLAFLHELVRTSTPESDSTGTEPEIIAPRLSPPELGAGGRFSPPELGAGGPGWGPAMNSGSFKPPCTSSRFLHLLSVPADIAGVPLALLMTGYTGVLLSTTSTPVWVQNRWIGPLFTTSAFEVAASAVAFALELTGPSHSPSVDALKPIETAARIGTAISLCGYLQSAGPLAKPLTQGRYLPHMWGVGASLLLPPLLHQAAGHLHRRGAKKASKGFSIAASLIALVGGFALKWAIGSAGHPSGRDPEAAREAARPDPREPS